MKCYHTSYFHAYTLNMFSYPHNNHPYSLNNLKILNKKQEKTKIQYRTTIKQ
jgi:hypothetical protein